jgi:NTE family protein
MSAGEQSQASAPGAGPPRSAHAADGVFQGGGVKGLALAGALLEFADRTRHPDGYVDEWVQLAGTSAGAIVAAYLACGYTPADTLALIRETDFTRFEDWGPGGELLGGARNLLRHHGLARGAYFRDWFSERIEQRTFRQVTESGRALKVIATDITRREMLVLPDALSGYRVPGAIAPIDPASFAVADAVRMSMSIPYFFEPVELVHHETGQPSTIVDGGVLSNFPVWIFDVADRDPRHPSFGFKLTGGHGPGGAGIEHVVKAFGWPVQMGIDIFSTAMEAWDSYWVSHGTLVRTCAISAGTVGTTDFHLDEAAKQGLIASGEAAASAFLQSWDRSSYVNSYGRHLAA